MTMMTKLISIIRHFWQTINSWIDSIWQNEVFEMQQGEIDVSGKSSISITLDGLPCSVHAHFLDDQACVPCNPHVDTLEYEVKLTHTRHHKKWYVLEIRWDVGSIRKIKWKAEY